MIYVDERIMHVECAVLWDARPASVSGAVRQALIDEALLTGLIYMCCRFKTDGGVQAITRHGLKAERAKHAVSRIHDGRAMTDLAELMSKKPVGIPGSGRQVGQGSCSPLLGTSLPNVSSSIYPLIGIAGRAVAASSAASWHHALMDQEAIFRLLRYACRWRCVTVKANLTESLGV